MTCQVLQGQMIWDQKESQREYQLFSQWHQDLQVRWPDYERIILLEVEARLWRIAQSMPLHPSLPTQPMTTRLPRPVEAMIGLITENYMEPLQLGQIARAVGLHPGYATDLFRKTIGITIMGYLAHIVLLMLSACLQQPIVGYWISQWKLASLQQAASMLRFRKSRASHLVLIVYLSSLSGCFQKYPRPFFRSEV
ncbi:MAG: AraC family transcriptional regulator [Chloroflexi bacterium]|nr:AraC family transcriptional regulator [Chloroflexota bacterium]